MQTNKHTRRDTKVTFMFKILEKIHVWDPQQDPDPAPKSWSQIRLKLFRIHNSDSHLWRCLKSHIWLDCKKLFPLFIILSFIVLDF
jgi:hypothetical protein